MQVSIVFCGRAGSVRSSGFSLSEGQLNSVWFADRLKPELQTSFLDDGRHRFSAHRAESSFLKKGTGAIPVPCSGSNVLTSITAQRSGCAALDGIEDLLSAPDKGRRLVRVVFSNLRCDFILECFQLVHGRNEVATIEGSAGRL